MKVLSPITDIIVESPQKFKQTIEGFREVSEFPKYGLNHAITSTENKYTLYGNTCTILGMSNGKDTYLGHFAPEGKTNDFKDKLDYVVKKFQDKTGQLSAIITGAYDYRILTPIKNQAKNSYEQMTDVAEILDKNNAIVSLICGKKHPVFMDNLAITQDRFIFSHSPKPKTPPITEFTTKDSMNEFLKNNYSVFEIDEKHSINCSI